MKKLLLVILVAVVSLSTNTFAQISAILQHTNGTVEQFMGTYGLSLALDAANNGDFIYLSGGAFDAPDDITQSVSIFGAGHYPDSTGATGVTTIAGNLRLDSCNNFYIEGVLISGNLVFSNDNDTNYNLTFVRCRVNNNISHEHSQGYSNMVNFLGCVIDGQFNYSKFSSVSIQNCILTGFQIGSIGNVFSNNIFTNQFINSASLNNIFSNNIFLRQQNSYLLHTDYNNTFYNNLVYSVNLAGNYYIDSSGGAIDTLLVDFISTNSTAVFTYQSDFHLRHPEIYVGNDGTPIGIYGGTHAYKEGAVPSNPHIQFTNIAPHTDGQGQLPVNIRVRAQGGTDE